MLNKLPIVISNSVRQLARITAGENLNQHTVTRCRHRPGGFFVACVVSCLKKFWFFANKTSVCPGLLKRIEILLAGAKRRGADAPKSFGKTLKKRIK
jgi:hypothetical protein